GNNDLLLVRPGSSMAFSVFVVGRSNTVNEKTGAYRIDCVISGNDAGTVATIVGSSKAVLGETDAGLDTNVSTSGGALNVNVVNPTGAEMRWVATVFTTEVVED